jgi:hypothetical protein
MIERYHRAFMFLFIECGSSQVINKRMIAYKQLFKAVYQLYPWEDYSRLSARHDRKLYWQVLF